MNRGREKENYCLAGLNTFSSECPLVVVAGGAYQHSRTSSLAFSIPEIDSNLVFIQFT